jgi:glyoxylase-like metal-dependent hydrolase (beta-lactamase superfamily II)
MIVEQMLVGPMAVFCYIVGCEQTREGVLIDRTGARIVMHEADVRLFDLPSAKIMASQMGFRASPPTDLKVKDGDRIRFGNESLEVIHTPGHTPGSMCLYGKKNLFTGDTLFVGAVGRTDLPGGSFDVLLQSLKHKIMPLPDDTIVWPGHDYGETPASTIGREKQTNPYLTDFF